MNATSAFCAVAVTFQCNQLILNVLSLSLLTTDIIIDYNSQ